MTTPPETTTLSLILGVVGIVLSIPAWAIFLFGLKRVISLVRAGTPLPGRVSQPLQRVVTVLTQVVSHKQLARKPLVAVAHWLVMVGFLLGVVLWFEAYIQTFFPDSGWPWLSHQPWYHLADELLGVGTVLGILTLVAIRFTTGGRQRLQRFYGSNTRAALFVEAVVFIEGAGMLGVKAAKIATYPDYDPHPATDFVTMHLANLLPASPTLVSVFALIKLLSGLVWLAVVGRNLSWGVAWHRFTAFGSLFFRTHPDGRKALGGMTPLVADGTPVRFSTLDEVPETLGTGTLKDASFKMLLDATACTECGRCQEQCPAWNTGKPLSPKKFVTDLRDGALGMFPDWIDKDALTVDDSHAGVDVLKLAGTGGLITQDVLFSCTNCGACVEQCPVDIEHLDHVANMRRYSVMVDSDFPDELSGMFTNLERSANPWGRAKKERTNWITKARKQGVEVPVFGEDVTDFSDLEYLFWVGCAGAFDDDAQKTTIAVVECLHTAGVKFAVLGTGESCTGDPARRAGNELLFQMLAEDNVATLNDVFDGVPKGARKIITTCPHCFNTLKNEYPDFDGLYDVFHHTQLLNRLVRDKRLVPIPRTPDKRAPVTFHDPCFLGRHNKVFDPPRELVTATGSTLNEMPRNKNEGFCCGAGGARMFMEENLGTRVADMRAQEAIATGSETIAVGCPFCHVMLTGGVKAAQAGDSTKLPKVKDVAVMLRQAIADDAGVLPAAQPKSFVDPARTQLTITPKRRDMDKTSTPVSTPRPPHMTPDPNATIHPIAPATPVASPIPGTAIPRPVGSPLTESALPKPPGTAPAPGKAPAAPGVSTPGTAVPVAPATPGKAAPAQPVAPGNAAPVSPGSAAPSAPATPGAARPPLPGSATPPAPGAATPTPASPAQPKPLAPGAARPALTPPGGNPAGALQPIPKAKPPAVATPPVAAPGSAKPVAAPGSAKPSAAPGSAKPVAAPGGVKPVAAPGSATPVVSPGSAKPITAPGTAKPVAAPGAARPVAPGSATPPAPGAPGAVAAPGSAQPAAQPAQTAAPAPGGVRPAPVTPAVTPPAPGGVQPPRPGGATPPAPGSARPVADPQAKESDD